MSTDLTPQERDLLEHHRSQLRLAHPKFLRWSRWLGTLADLFENLARDTYNQAASLQTHAKALRQEEHQAQLLAAEVEKILDPTTH